MPKIAADGEMLDSWKEIAVFLNRGVRTVQRWEATEGLPVRRHDHLRRGSVYALRSDITLWVRTRYGGRKRPAESLPTHQCRELRLYIAQQKVIMREIRSEVKVQLANVMSSWSKLQLTAAQANQNALFATVPPGNLKPRYVASSDAD